MTQKFLKAWTANLPSQEADELVKLLGEASRVRERLTSILDQRIEGSVSEQLKKSAYDCPNWAYAQADAIGYQRALREVIELLALRGK